MNKRVTAIVIVTGMVFCFFNCNKATITTPASLRIINVDPGSASQSMYLNGKVIQPTGIAYGSNNYFYSISPPGTYSFNLSPANSGVYDIDFGPAKNYLMFLLNVGGTLQPEVAETALNTLGYDTSGVRFFDFSPNSQLIDVAFKLDSIYNLTIYQSDTLYHIADTTYTLYTARAYNDQYDNASYKAFSYLPSGLYNVKLRYADSTLAIDSMELSFVNGRSYTIYARGYMLGGSSMPPLIIDTILH